MQISSANSAPYSRSGSLSNIGSSVLPAARKPEAGSASNESVAIPAASDARSLQRVAPPVTLTDSEASRGLVLARQRAGFAAILQISQSASDVSAQRAVAQYNIVAVQEQRYEVDEVLTGIDVFA